MKKTLLITAAALAAAMFPTARAAEKIPYSRAYVSVLTKAAVELPADAKKRRIETWKMGKGETACNLVRYNHYSQNPREWGNASFKFKALEDGTAKITLLFAEIKANGKVVPYGAYYDDVHVNGKLLPNGDFENDFDKWEIYCPQKNGISPKAEFRESITGGGKCARVSRLGSISQAFKIKAGETYEISFRTKYAGILSAADDDFPLDLSKFFNYGGGSKVMAKVALPDPKIPEGGVDIEGVRFASKPADGKRALVLRNKLSPVVPHAVEIALTPDQKAARYLYVLHTLYSANIPGDTIGRVVFMSKGAAIAKREVALGKSVGWSHEHGRGLNAKSVKVDGGYVYFSRFDIPPNTEKIIFQCYYKSPWIIYAATLSESFRYPFETFTPSPDKWTRADVERSFCEVKGGSALDLSGLVQTPVPAGATGRAIISERGTIAFEKTPGADARFKSYSLWQAESFAKIPAESRREAIKKYASLLRPQGYNLVRVKLDLLKSHRLLANRGEYFDMIDCLFAELKKNGVYYQIVLGAYDDGRKNYYYDYRDDVKMLAILGDAETLRNWKNSTLEWLNHINPYTGLAWKDDPALLSLEYYNELTICLGRLYRLTPEVRARAVEAFARHLEKKYKTVEDLNDSWNKAKVRGVPYSFKNFKEVREAVVLSHNFDWHLFAWENVGKFGAFAEGVLREAGYKGLVSECNTAASFAGRAYANKFTDVVIINTYYSHPQGGFSSRDVSCSQASGIGEDWITNSVVSRKLSNRPASITEYNYCFWNKYRYEACVLISPYCALQNFSALTIHQDVIPVRPLEPKRPFAAGVGSFSVGMSPVMRASELLMSCFFMRGDVKASPHRVDLVVPDGFSNTPDYARSPNPEQARIAALTGFAMKYPKMDFRPPLGGVKLKPADIEISPIGSANIRIEAWFQEVEKGSGGFDLDKFVSVLREKKILPEGNVTDVKNGVYQSDTGQITRDMKNRTMKVVTEKSEAVAMEKSKREKLGALTVESTSVPATIGVCSIDGEKISASKRLVFVYATREVNEDTETSFDYVYAIYKGGKNLMLENGVVKAKLKLDPGREYEVYALSLDGARREKLDMKVKDGVMEIEIDNSKLKHGSTSLFEIAAK